MIRIRAKIDFDIVEKVNAGTDLRHLFDEPAEIICDKPDDMKKLALHMLRDSVLKNKTVEQYEALLGGKECTE